MNGVFIRVVFVLIFTGLVCACTDTPDSTVGSDVVNTSEIYSVYRVISDGGSLTQVEAQLTVGIAPSDESDDDIFVDLTEEDSLLVSSGDTVDDFSVSGDDLFAELDLLYSKFKPLERARTVETTYEFLNSGYIFSDQIWYSKVLSNTEDRVYNLSLLRSGYRNAEASSVTLPSAFDLRVENQGQLFSRSMDSLVLTWTQLEENVSVEIVASLSCPGGISETFEFNINSDTGGYTINPGELSSDRLTGVCSASVRVIKFRVGNLDSVYSGGIIVGYEIRTLSMNSTD